MIERLFFAFPSMCDLITIRINFLHLRNKECTIIILFPIFLSLSSSLHTF